MTNEVQQWEQLHDTLNGKQNFCIIEERKAPVLYDLVVQKLQINDLRTSYRFGDEGSEIHVGRDGFFKAYLDLLESRPRRHRHDFQIAMGTLLGYDIESCIEFASDPPDCGCEKCGGPDTVYSEAVRDVWVRAGCRHTLRDRVRLGDRQQDQHGKWFQLATSQDGRKVFGKVYEPDPSAIEGNPALQPWSRGDGQKSSYNVLYGRN